MAVNAGGEGDGGEGRARRGCGGLEGGDGQAFGVVSQGFTSKLSERPLSLC